jgi:acetyl esterase/lipase
VRSPVLEPEARSFADATNHPPYLFDLEPSVGRKTVDEVQSPEVEVPGTVKEMVTIDGGPSGTVSISIFRPVGVAGPLPVVLFIHGAGWVFGNDHTHGRLARELAKGSEAALVFPNYSLSPEARFPVATEENYAAAQWIVAHGSDHDLDPSRMIVAGDSVGGNMSASLTLTAKERGDVRLIGQVLFYPVTDTSFDTESYQQFSTGYFLRRDGMQWFWDQYTTDPGERAMITASPLRATPEQLAGLPPALVITGEADVLRDEGEAYATKLREAGVPVIATRYEGIIHDFVMLNALRPTQAAHAAISQAVGFMRDRFSATN